MDTKCYVCMENTWSFSPDDWSFTVTVTNMLNHPEKPSLDMIILA